MCDVYVFGSGRPGCRGGGWIRGLGFTNPVGTGTGGVLAEWMRELGLGFTNPLGTGGVLDMCLCFGCGEEVGSG